VSDGTTTAPADLSVVVPFYEEEEAIESFFAELLGVLDRLPQRSEVIAIDDGSGDGTFARLVAVRERDPRVKVIRFRRNFGQTAGLAAGFAHASGAVVVTMDGTCRTIPPTSRVCSRSSTRASTWCRAGATTGRTTR